jgi:FkbM family methyltransferase
MFSRGGLVTLGLQRFIGGLSRILKLLRFKKISRSIQESKTSAISRYQSWCVAFLAEVLQSNHYNLFIDFGAHKGEQTFVANKYMRTIAFEPDPRAFETLVGMQPVRIDPEFQLTLENKAISTYTGVGQINFLDANPNKTGGSTIQRNKMGFSGSNSTECAFLDVLEVLDAIEEPSKCILKIDIEGAEYSVLTRMVGHPKFRDLGLIFVEYHERKMKNGYWLSLKLTAVFWQKGIRRSRLIEWH